MPKLELENPANRHFGQDLPTEHQKAKKKSKGKGAGLKDYTIFKSQVLSKLNEDQLADLSDLVEQNADPEDIQEFLLRELDGKSQSADLVIPKTTELKSILDRYAYQRFPTETLSDEQRRIKEQLMALKRNQVREWSNASLSVEERWQRRGLTLLEGVSEKVNENGSAESGLFGKTAAMVEQTVEKGAEIAEGQGLSVSERYFATEETAEQTTKVWEKKIHALEVQQQRVEMELKRREIETDLENPEVSAKQARIDRYKAKMIEQRKAQGLPYDDLIEEPVEGDTPTEVLLNKSIRDKEKQLRRLEQGIEAEKLTIEGYEENKSIAGTAMQKAGHAKWIAAPVALLLRPFEKNNEAVDQCIDSCNKTIDHYEQQKEVFEQELAELQELKAAYLENHNGEQIDEIQDEAIKEEALSLSGRKVSYKYDGADADFLRNRYTLDESIALSGDAAMAAKATQVVAIEAGLFVSTAGAGNAIASLRHLRHLRHLGKANGFKRALGFTANVVKQTFRPIGIYMARVVGSGAAMHGSTQLAEQGGHVFNGDKNFKEALSDGMSKFLGGTRQYAVAGSSFMLAGPLAKVVNKVLSPVAKKLSPDSVIGLISKKAANSVFVQKANARIKKACQGILQGGVAGSSNATVMAIDEAQIEVKRILAFNRQFKEIYQPMSFAEFQKSNADLSKSEMQKQYQVYQQNLLDTYISLKEENGIADYSTLIKTGLIRVAAGGASGSIGFKSQHLSSRAGRLGSAGIAGGEVLADGLVGIGSAFAIADNERGELPTVEEIAAEIRYAVMATSFSKMQSRRPQSLNATHKKTNPEVQSKSRTESGNSTAKVSQEKVVKAEQDALEQKIRQDLPEKKVIKKTWKKLEPEVKRSAELYAKQETEPLKQDLDRQVETLSEYYRIQANLLKIQETKYQNKERIAHVDVLEPRLKQEAEAKLKELSKAGQELKARVDEELAKSKTKRSQEVDDLLSKTAEQKISEAQARAKQEYVSRAKQHHEDALARARNKKARQGRGAHFVAEDEHLNSNDGSENNGDNSSNDSQDGQSFLSDENGNDHLSDSTAEELRRRALAEKLAELQDTEPDITHKREYGKDRYGRDVERIVRISTEPGEGRQVVSEVLIDDPANPYANKPETKKPPEDDLILPS